MPESRIAITPQELEKALRVWLTVCPKRTWHDFWFHSETVAKWGSGAAPRDRFDPRHALAQYLAGKFAQACWEVARPPIEHPAGNPAPSVDPDAGDG
ncbi:MAG TPA: hypothetical protein VIT38_02120 [Allosphingosinicella sp.]